MAIGKWIPFANTGHASTNTTTAVVEQPPVITAADAKQFGLENFGNTCYANSVLQALYFCGPFRELLTQYPDPSAPDLLSLPPPAIPHAQPAPAPTPAPRTVRGKLERKFSISESSPAQQSPMAATSNTNGVAAPAIPLAPPTLLSALRSLFLYISKNPADRGTVAPKAFIDKLKELNELFRSSMHQDAHEFLNFLLNRIVEEMEDDRKHGNGHNGKAPSGEDLSTSVGTLSSTAVQTAPSSFTGIIGSTFTSTFVHRLFEGVLTSETRCLTCETVSSRDESFLDLSIDIEQNSSVTACLRQFSASEMLCQRNKFFCDFCCDLQEAEKRMKIKKLPNILALHLKRFKYQEDVGKYIKLAYRVAFPLQLRLFNTVDDAEDPDRLYELFAIVVHIGNGPHHGHYVTIIKARGIWMLFDDDNVEIIKESEISRYFGDSPNGCAYVLYYQAVDLDMVALGLREPVPEPSTTEVGSAPGKTVEVSVASEGSERDLESPALPPGLTEEPDASDKSDSPSIGTPASHPIPLSTSTGLKAPFMPGSVPSSISTQSGQGSSSTSSQPASPSGTTLGGIFHTLRRPPSRARANGSASENRRSFVEPPPPVPLLPASVGGSHRPGTSHSVTSTETSQHDVSMPSSPIMSKGSLANGASKDKSGEKKAWFKRKTSRLDTPASSTPALDRSGSARARNAPATPPLDIPRPQTASPVPSPSSPVSTSRLAGEHKKSSPELLRGRSKHESSRGPTSKLPPRPSTAGATVGSSSFSRPASGTPDVPPLPASLTSARNASPVSPTADPGAPGTKGKDRESPRRGLDGPASLPSPPPPVLGPLGLGFTMSTGTTASGASASSPDSPVSASSGAGGNWKRATRKLSLTAPMLGFGRREKERDRDRGREREKDKER
ncbi:cysteine proteinase [Obba rivulosa]|uniref:Ubiquitin carboxyl-terminal hydrolase n=1 Tax=Obba rivulosa TaxID=1052685 RepID=A0A8E2DK39_9APHY|nr:cysteine proteinase [Obba rivulosa]